MVVVRAIDSSGWPVLLSDATEARVPIDTSTLSSRRRDIVRELAREFEDFSDQDLREMLPQEISKAMTTGDLWMIRQDVRRQVVDDLVDVLDQRHRGTLRARRTVRVLAPKGYTKKVLRGLTSDELSDVSRRLVARGWSGDDLKRTLPLDRRRRTSDLDVT